MNTPGASEVIYAFQQLMLLTQGMDDKRALRKLAQQAQQQNETDGWSILLFVDNCTAQYDVVPSNVKLIFLFPNTTSKLQPCDAGIIKTVKVHYRKKLQCHIIKIEWMSAPVHQKSSLFQMQYCG